MVWALVAKVRRRFEVRIEGFGMATVLVTEGVVRIDCSPRREPGQSALYPFDTVVFETQRVIICLFATMTAPISSFI